MISLVVKVTGFVKEGLFARTFGVSTAVDEFYLTFLIINFAVTIVSGAIVSTLIPIYFEKGGKEQRSQLIYFAFLFTLIINILLVTTFLLFASGISEGSLFQYFLLFAPIVVFGSFVGVISAVLNANRIFIFPTLVTVLTPLTPLWGLWFSKDPGLLEIAVYTTAGYGFSCILVFLLFWFQLGQPKFFTNLSSIDKAFLYRFTQSFFVLLGGYLFLPGIEVVSQYIVSENYPGGVAKLSYAGKITSGIYSVLAVSLGTVLFPEYARLYADKKFGKIYNYLVSHSIIILFSLVIFSFLLSLFSNEVIKIAFQGGRFGELDAINVSSLQIFMFFYIPFFVLITLNSRILSSMKRNVDLLKINIAVLIFHAVVTLLFASRYGIHIIPVITLMSASLHWFVSLFRIRYLIKRAKATDNSSEKMSISFLINSLDVGGAERQLTQIANGMAIRGHQVTIYVFYGGRPLEKELNEKVEVVDLKKMSKWENFYFLFKLTFEVARKSPDVFYSFLTVSNIFATVLRVFSPSTKIIWGIRNANYDKVAENWSTLVAFKVEKFLSFIPHAVICNSYRALEEIQNKGYPKDRCLVVPNGIDVERFKPCPVARDKVRESFGIKNNDVLIGMVARWDPVKDHGTFFDAINIIKEKYSNIRVLCVGNGGRDRFERVQKIAEDKNLLEFINWVHGSSSPQDYYSAFDLSVSTSLSEGFPNVIGESMASNIFQVVTDVGDSAFVVGGEGRVIEPGNPEDLSKTLMQIIDKELFKMHKSRERVLNNFSINQVNNLNEAIFNDVIEERFQLNDNNKALVDPLFGNSVT